MIPERFTPFPPQLIQYLILFATIGALIFAYGAEYGFGIHPCELCYYQRYLFWGLLGTGLLTVYSDKKVLVYLQLLIISLGIALSIYHVGIENHWWAGPKSCSGALPGNPGTIEALKSQLMAQPIARCDQVNWAIFAVSATIWTLLLQLGLFVLGAALIALRKPSRL